MKKKLNRKNIVAAAIMIFCAASAGAGTVYADEGVGKGNPMSGLAGAIAQKFNLNQAEVQAVFDQQRGQWQEKRQEKAKQMEAAREQKFADYLAKLVGEGKIKPTQAEAIKAKRAELEAKIASQAIAEKSNFKNMTAEERKEAMETRKTKLEADREALKQWANANGIPEQYVPMVGLMGGGHGRGGGFGGSGFDGAKLCPKK